MSSLTVVYGTRRFKVPVTPSTLLSQVRDEVCTSKNGLSLEGAQYGLARQGKALDLTLPFRFAGLVNNAHIDLIKLNTNVQTPIRVKVRIPDGKDFVGTFQSGTKVGDVAEAAGLKGVPLTLGGNTQADPNGELRSLGGGAGGLLFTAAQNRSSLAHASSQHTAHSSSYSNAHASSPSTPTSTSVPASDPVGINATSTEKDHNDHSIKPSRNAVVITEHNAPAAAAETDEPPEMGVSQFRTYYSHLKAQAEPAMVSKETRERMRNEKRKQIEASTIRVKLPDQSFLEGKFQKGEHGEQVYSFVRSYLRTPNEAFALKSMNPTFTLDPKHDLMEDCRFGSRALLVFEWLNARKSSEPILNDEAMVLARPVTDQNEGPDRKTNPGPHSATRSEETFDTRKRDTLKKAVPKWMRLHKT